MKAYYALGMLSSVDIEMTRTKYQHTRNVSKIGSIMFTNESPFLRMMSGHSYVLTVR